MPSCTHRSHIHNVVPRTPNGCEECLKLGDPGYICACAWSAATSAAATHRRTSTHGAFPRTKHPIMRSIEPGENWGWCYIDDMVLDVG